MPPISSTKSLTGHSLGAVGVQEAIYSLLMMNNGFICESANIDELDPEFADVPIVRKRQDNANLNCVMSNSFGFGGTNATLVMKTMRRVRARAPPARGFPQPRTSRSPERGEAEEPQRLGRSGSCAP